MKTFKIKTLGCKVNSYESQFIRSLFICNNYKEIENNHLKADICIINTCTVTNTSDNKSKKTINSERKLNKDAIIIAVGCFCQYKGEEVENLIDADIILGNKDKSKIIDYLNEYIKTRKRIIKFYNMSNVPFEDMEIKEFKHHHRAFIKVQDGCDNFCSYCIIPYVRGNLRSKDPDKVINEINNLEKKFHKEVVLSGIHTGKYNYNNKTLTDLINEIIIKTKIERIRLSSVEIVELNADFLLMLKNNSRFVSHLHIPLQSGSNHTLKQMNRRYSAEYFKSKVEQIRKVRPNISISTDIIVGFPGETEEDFNKTLQFCKEIKFSKIHVFPYSDRTGTLASKMNNKIAGSIKKERVKKLIELSNKLEENYFNSCVSKKETVLIEEYKDGYYYGFTSNYLYLKIKGDYKINEIYEITIEKDMKN